MVEPRPGLVIEIRTPVWDESSLYRSLLQKVREVGTDPQVMVAPILEPLKCRLVSKGDTIPYYLAKPHQRAMWSHLASKPQFQLIGRPLDLKNKSEIRWLDELTRAGGLAFDKWVSGDYSAATDGLSQDVNRQAFEASLRAIWQKRCAREIASGKRDEYLRLLRQVMYSVCLNYPRSKEMTEEQAAQLDPVQMTNGQLMGSPLSFPILCAINLVGYWLALEEYTGRSWKLDQLPVLVNGDDILFKANDQFYEVWQRWVSRSGFTLSVGKNYIHPRVFSVNSQFYRVVGDSFEPVVAFDPGMVTGLVSKTGRTETRVLPWTSRWNRACASSASPEWTMRRFMCAYSSQIAATTHNGLISMFLPTHLGGLGLVQPEGWQAYRTGFQEQFGSWCWNQLEKIDATNDIEGAKRVNFDVQAAIVPPSLCLDLAPPKGCPVFLLPEGKEISPHLVKIQDGVLKVPGVSCSVEGPRGEPEGVHFRAPGPRPSDIEKFRAWRAQSGTVQRKIPDYAFQRHNFYLALPVSAWRTQRDGSVVYQRRAHWFDPDDTPPSEEALRAGPTHDEWKQSMHQELTRVRLLVEAAERSVFLGHLEGGLDPSF
jgi:hypothetical protein